VNKLRAKIVNIESSDHVSLVDLNANGDIFSCVIIETPDTADYLRINNEVFILFKETEVSIGKKFSGDISMRNQIHTTITKIQKGSVLTEIYMDYKGLGIGSIITTRSAKSLNLEIGDSVIGFVKANEVSIMTIDEENK